MSLCAKGETDMRQHPEDIKHMVKTELRNRRAYFQNTKKETASSNLKFLIAANISALVFLIGFILLTPYIIKGWKPTCYHISFIPALLFCAIITFIYYMRKNWQSRIVTILCILFSAVLLAFSILLDTVGTPDGPGTFLPMMFIIIPSLFTLPFSISYGLIITAEIIYIAVVIISKNNVLGQYDIFSSIVALAFSVIVANMIMILRVRDYTIQTKYKYRSMTDGLTNILNKRACFEAFREYFLLYNPQVTCTLIVMDLDDFKALNDTKGHASGDEVLHQTGMLLLDTFRRIDIVGRFGGDEFVILMKGTASAEIARERCRTLQNNLRRISQIETGMQITGSFGIILADKQEINFSALFLQADEALYEAKHKGKATYVIKHYQSKENDTD